VASKGSSLKSYVAKRLLLIPIVILVVIFVNFTIINFASGNPIHMLCGEFTPSPEFVEQLTKEYGLNESYYVRLFKYSVKVFQGDLGYSFYYGQSVSSLIAERMPTTFLLMIPPLIFSAILGMVLGIVSATSKKSVVDNLISTFAAVGYSLPVFFVALILMEVFSILFPIFPAGGLGLVKGVGLQYIVQILRYLILPWATLITINVAFIIRLTRSKVSDLKVADFVTTAKAKGLSEFHVIYKHILPNSLSPIITVIGMNFGLSFMGAIVTETIFGIPGMGQLLSDAIHARDVPIIMGIFVVVAIIVALANLTADIVCAHLDPRIRCK